MKKSFYISIMGIIFVPTIFCHNVQAYSNECVTRTYNHVQYVECYDAKENMISKEFPQLSSGKIFRTTYAYDDDGNLVKEKHSFDGNPDWSIVYGNDINGERIRKYYHGDSDNGGELYGYGDFSKESEDSDGLSYFVASINYRYQGYLLDGEKVVGKMSCKKKDLNNCSMEYFNDDGKIIAKYDVNGNPTEAYDYDDEGNKAVYNSQCEMIALYDPEGNILPLEDDTTDEEGLLVDDQPSHQTRRIYTVQEAKDALGTLNKNTFIIRYR